MQIVLGMVSVLGAAVFFLAGLLWPRRNLEADQRSRLASECDRLAGLAAASAADVQALEGEAARLRKRNDSLRSTLGRRRVELASARAALASSQRRSEGLDDEGHQLLQRAMIAEGENERLRAALAAERKASEELKRRRGRWHDQLATLQAGMTQVPSRDLERTLRHELAMAEELLRNHDQRAERLGEENLGLREKADELALRLSELERLRSENQELRALGLRGPRPEDGTPRPALPAVEGGPAEALQRLVARISDAAEVRSAVVADEQGLVVACQGEHGEELAALGALFVRAGSQARHILPLRDLSRVTIEDEQSVSVTVAPLPGPADHDSNAQLALIMLATGAPPDARKVALLLGGGGQAASSP